MKGKLLFVAGAAVGYILGARAGRKRYEQIKGAAQKVWDTPAVQRQVGQVQDFAADKVGELPELMLDGAKKLVSTARKAKADAKTEAKSAANSGGGSGRAPDRDSGRGKGDQDADEDADDDGRGEPAPPVTGTATNPAKPPQQAAPKKRAGSNGDA